MIKLYGSTKLKHCKDAKKSNPEVYGDCEFHKINGVWYLVLETAPGDKSLEGAAEDEALDVEDPRANENQSKQARPFDLQDEEK